MKPDLNNLKALATFCRTYGAPGYYRDWGTLALLEYLNFHAQQGTLQVVQSPTTEVQGLGVVWQDWQRRVRATLAAGQVNYFHWQRSAPAGDCYVAAHFVVTPAARRGPVLAQLVRACLTRFAGGADRPVLLLRHHAGRERFTEYRVQTIRRLAHLTPERMSP